MEDFDKVEFIKYFNYVQNEINYIANVKGWWDDMRSASEVLALIHGEVSETLEAFREGNPDSNKIEDFSKAEEELADILIRCMDFADEWGFNLGGAIIAKMEYNKKRPYKHGKLF